MPSRQRGGSSADLSEHSTLCQTWHFSIGFTNGSSPIFSKVLDEAAAAVAAGVTTDEIDRIVHEATVDR